MMISKQTIFLVSFLALILLSPVNAQGGGGGGGGGGGSRGGGGSYNNQGCIN